MNWKNSVAVFALCALASPATAAPVLNVAPGGLQGGNWVWDVSVTPDLALAGGHTPLAVELGFRLTNSPLVNVTNVNPIEFDTPNPGKIIFGWETLDPTANNHPVGLQKNLGTSEIFAAFGSINFFSAGPKPFLRITASGPSNGGSTTSTIQWLGAYALNGRIAQLDTTSPFFSTNFDILSGTATQIPEPADCVLLLIGSAIALLRKRTIR